MLPTNPDKTAYIMAGSGVVVSCAELEAQSNQGAHLFRRLGLHRGDHVALLLENHPRFLQICWAAQRAGLYYTAINCQLPSGEVEYILNNYQASVFITSADQAEVARPLLEALPEATHRFMVDGAIDGFENYEDALSTMPDTPIADQYEGAPMAYSSGTTGYPKGIKQPLPEGIYGSLEGLAVMTTLYGATDESIYLSTAPLYHPTSLSFTMTCIRRGITVVVMEEFTPEFALECIAKYRITHSQWVPTMFVRMLKLPRDARLGYDLSSLQCAIHAAAPCPVPVKEAMIEWWGPIIHEYYAGSEGNGFVQLDSTQWLAHKGSVGRPLNCEIYICDEEGDTVPIGESGTIYFAGGGRFEYYKDTARTAAATHSKGWTTLGDVGYLDKDGYLYLTDRKHFVIIFDGVTIYPQEAENILVMHDKIADVAVFGVPSAEFGEEVKAIVQLVDGVDPSTMLEVELLDFCRARLSYIKCPRSVDFHAELPRHANGKDEKDTRLASLQQIGR